MTAATPLDSLLALLQLSDSAFPSGSFTHSYGLEQAAREGLVRSPEEVEAFVASVLRQSAAPSDAAASYRASIAASQADLDAVLALDRAYLRLKAASELRAAALMTGRRLLAETATHTAAPVLQGYAEAVRLDSSLGAHPVAFGVVCSVLGVPARDVPAALLFSSANAMLQAAMRLLPFSHRDAQAALHRLRPEIAALTAQVFQHPSALLASFHPLQEIASMRHAAAEARLFRS